jgi:DNA polymerase-1
MRIEREKSRKTGIAKTFWGRSRKMGLSSSNNINCSEPGIRGHWERSVCSHIIQGTAADIMKLAIVLVRRDLIKAGLYDDVKILLTVHDQLLFRAKKRVVRQAIPIIRNAMELKIAGWVPIKFEMSVGTRWGSCKKLKDTEYADL